MPDHEFPMVTDEIIEQAIIIWKYLVTPKPPDDDLAASDFAIVFGCHDVSVARHACTVAKPRRKLCIVLSGGNGLLTHLLPVSEASIFYKIVKSKAIENEIVLEDKSQHSLENIRLSRLQLQEKYQGRLHRGIAITKPYSARRIHALVQKQWPAVDWRVDACTRDFGAYLKMHGDDPSYRELTIHFIAGEIDRINNYAGGSLLEQYVPDIIWNAYYKLDRAGFGIDKPAMKAKRYYGVTNGPTATDTRVTALRIPGRTSEPANSVADSIPEWSHKEFLSLNALKLLMREAGEAWSPPLMKKREKS